MRQHKSDQMSKPISSNFELITLKESLERRQRYNGETINWDLFHELEDKTHSMIELLDYNTMLTSVILTFTNHPTQTEVEDAANLLGYDYEDEDWSYSIHDNTVILHLED